MPSIKEKYEKYRPKKFLGQNFLVDENIALKIVKSLNVSKNDTVIEIGPGQGILTKHFLSPDIDFTAVELDRSICLKLEDKFKEKLILVNCDFLKFDLIKFTNNLPKGKKLKIIGNIPYNITTEILFKLFDTADKIDTAVLMMQKEVAQRLKAKPGSKEYGILAVQTQVNSKPEILFNVSPGSFFPKPKVESSVIRLSFSNINYGIINKEMFRDLVRSSFGQRRKTLSNSLKTFFQNPELSGYKPEFDYGRRAESVSIEEFVNISNKISEHLLINSKNNYLSSHVKKTF